MDEGVDSNSEFGDHSTALHLAAESGNVKLLILLLSYPKTNPNLTDVEGQTSLHLAARNDFKDIIIILLKHNAEVNKSDKMGCTPIHNAVFIGNEEMVHILLESNANPNLLNAFGQSPLYLAANERPNKRIVKKLIVYNADLNLYTPNCTMPLLMGKAYS